MSRTKAHAHCLIGLCLLAAGFALTATIAIPAASAGQVTKPDPPSLLWKSYPLDQRSTTTVQEEQIRGRQASGQTSAHQDHFLIPVLVSAFMLLAAAAIVLMRRSAPVRVGNAQRTPDRAPMARSVQPASVDRRGSVRARAAPEPNRGPRAESSVGLLNALDDVTQIADGWRDDVWKRRWGGDEDARLRPPLRVWPLLFAKRLRYSDRTPYRQLRSLAVTVAISGLAVLATLAALRFVS